MKAISLNKLRELVIKKLEMQFKKGCNKDDANYYWKESFYWFTRAIDITIEEYNLKLKKYNGESN